MLPLTDQLASLARHEKYTDSYMYYTQRTVSDIVPRARQAPAL